MDEPTPHATKRPERAPSEPEFRPRPATVLKKNARRWGPFLGLHAVLLVVLAILVTVPGGVEGTEFLPMGFLFALVLLAIWVFDRPWRAPGPIRARDGALRLPVPARLATGERRRTVPLSFLDAIEWTERGDVPVVRFTFRDGTDLTMPAGGFEPEERAFLRQLEVELERRRG